MKNQKIDIFYDKVINNADYHRYSENSKPVRIIKESSIQALRFNVMPDKDVDEKVCIKEYRIWDNAIESIFDRQYTTAMIKSPSHLTFLSGLVNLQKMVYIYMHHHLSVNYKNDGEELIKVWPRKLDIDMPRMILKKKNISHLMIIKSIIKLKHNKYKVVANTTIDGSVAISGEALVVVL